MKRKNNSGTIRIVRKKYQAVSPDLGNGRISLGTYSTKTAANRVLKHYIENPYEKNQVTFCKLYEMWKEKKNINKGDQLAFQYCVPLYKKRVAAITEYDIRTCIIKGYRIHNGKRKYASIYSQQRIKTFLNRLFDYAVELGYMNENIPRKINKIIESENKKRSAKRTHRPFNDKEVEVLWSCIGNPYLSFVVIPILICMYHGIRPSQIVKIKKENLKTSESFIEVPIDVHKKEFHPVPIHPLFYDMIKNQFTKSMYLCTDEYGNEMTYDKFRGRFKKVMKILKMDDHCMADILKTFYQKYKESSADAKFLPYFLEVYNVNRARLVYTEYIKKEMTGIVSSIN